MQRNIQHQNFTGRRVSKSKRSCKLHQNR